MLPYYFIVPGNQNKSRLLTYLPYTTTYNVLRSKNLLRSLLDQASVHIAIFETKQVLICASCHRFVGTEATQLAMLQGLPLQGSKYPSHTANGSSFSSPGFASTKKKRRNNRTGNSSNDSSNKNDKSSSERMREMAVVGSSTRSRRIAIAQALPSDLPDFPVLLPQRDNDDGGNGGRGDGSSPSIEKGSGGMLIFPGGGVSSAQLPVLPVSGGVVSQESRCTNTEDNSAPSNCSSRGGGEEEGDHDVGCCRDNGDDMYVEEEGRAGEAEEGGGRESSSGSGGWECEGGAPCDDVYCSVRCREAAKVAGHGLICIGGKEAGRYTNRGGGEGGN